MKKILLIILFTAASKNLFATQQIPDLLLIGKDTLYLRSFPLEDIELKYRPFGLTRATAPHTGCWRGYHAIWRLINDTLYLEKILSCEWQQEAKEENIIELFKKNSLEKYINGNKIAATWYDKTLVRPAPANNVLHQNRIWLNEITYQQPKEEDIMLKFSKGILITNRLKNYKRSTSNGILFQSPYRQDRHQPLR